MKKTGLLSLFGLLAILSLPNSSAYAQQAIRTWVSGLGDDLAACSRTAPCKTFAGAIAKTAAGGEINCVDQGAYGAVAIFKSITIDCEGQFGGVLHSSTNGIIINPGAEKVMLRNLNISGDPPSSPGLNGIRIFGGGDVNIEKVVIHGQLAANPDGAGILVDKPNAGFLYLTVRDVTFYNMRYGVKMTTTINQVVASITNSRFNGIAINGVEAGQNTFAAVSNSVFSTINGSAILASTATSAIYAKDNLITNSYFGISASVSGAKINAMANALFGNAKAFNAAAGATFLSGGDNRFDVNPGSAATGVLGQQIDFGLGSKTAFGRSFLYGMPTADRWAVVPADDARKKGAIPAYGTC